MDLLRFRLTTVNSMDGLEREAAGVVVAGAVVACCEAAVAGKEAYLETDELPAKKELETLEAAPEAAESETTAGTSDIAASRGVLL